MKTGSTIKYICARTAFSLILGRSDLRGTGAHHLSGEAIRTAETAQMQFSRISDVDKKEMKFFTRSRPKKYNIQSVIALKHVKPSISIGG